MKEGREGLWDAKKIYSRWAGGREGGKGGGPGMPYYIPPGGVCVCVCARACVCVCVCVHRVRIMGLYSTK